MEIIMDDATYSYLMKKGGKLSINLMVPAGCCGGTMIPNIVFNEPPEKKASKFRKLSYRDLELYIDQVMDFKENIVELKLTKKMFMKDIELPTLQLI